MGHKRRSYYIFNYSGFRNDLFAQSNVRERNMDKLVLNIEDVDDKERFLRGLQKWLLLENATANGIFRKDVDPESNKDGGTVQILNNVPALSGKEVKYGDDGMVYFWKES